MCIVHSFSALWYFQNTKKVIINCKLRNKMVDGEGLQKMNKNGDAPSVNQRPEVPKLGELS